MLTSAFGYDPMGRLIKQFGSSTDHIAIERQYHYDNIGQLTHISGQTRLGSGGKSQQSNQKSPTLFGRNHQYRYDKIGCLTQHKLTDYTKHTGMTEIFAFDPASNRVPVSPVSETASDYNSQPIQTTGRPTQLTTHDSHLTYTYDSHGRVLYKTKTPLGKDGRPLKQSEKGVVGYRESLQLAYNANHELTQSIKTHQQGADIITQTTTYQYDAFGRRIAKQSTVKKASIVYPGHKKVLKTAQQTEKTEYQHIHYLWDGNRQRQERTDTHVFTTIYEQDSFAPVARLVWLHEELTKAANDEPSTPKTDIQIYHYHNDHLGTPNELTNQQGEVIWLADYEAWGNTAKVVWREERLEQLQVAKEDLQPLRFQGQYYDEETGLHYNRFRYFDPDMGMFISRDPIGLIGGLNVFQYAPNPIGWIDPFGLVHEKTLGHNVYELYDINSQTGQLADKPYYVGITDNIRRRTIEHENSGRLTRDGSTRLVARHKNITYGQARGYEQALIEQHGTKTGTRGVPISQSNRGNKINGFDVDSKTRGRTRQRYFKRHYKKMLKRLGGCT